MSHTSSRPSIGAVHVRRALLLFALVLGLTALAASVAPAPRQGGSDTVPGARRPPAAGAAQQPIEVAFRAGDTPRGAPARRVSAGAPVVVVVASGGPGQVTIPRLGRVASVTPRAPARFDLPATP